MQKRANQCTSLYIAFGSWYQSPLDSTWLTTSKFESPGCSQDLTSQLCKGTSLDSSFFTSPVWSRDHASHIPATQGPCNAMSLGSTLWSWQTYLYLSLHLWGCVEASYFANLSIAILPFPTHPNPLASKEGKGTTEDLRRIEMITEPRRTVSHQLSAYPRPARIEIKELVINGYRWLVTDTNQLRLQVANTLRHYATLL